MNYSPTYNQVHDHPIDITDDSEIITEPITLAEMKNFLRLEGFGPDGTPGVLVEEPLALTLLEGEITVQSDDLIGKVIIVLAREGLVYTKTTGSPGNREYVFDILTGEIEFELVGNAGGEIIDITYAGSFVASAFDDDDDLIEELITSAREGIEKFTGRSLINHTWKSLITNLAGDIELPFSNGIEADSSGPVLDSIVDCNGDDIEEENYLIRGTDFAFLETPLQKKMTVTYSVVPTVPKRLKQAIMRDVCYHYENRNDIPGELSKQAMSMAAAFKRVATFLA